MSAQYSNLPPEPGSSEAQPSRDGTSADAHLQVDPLQSFREYSSLERRGNPNSSSVPFDAQAVSEQPAYPGGLASGSGYAQPVHPGYAPDTSGYPAPYYGGSPASAYPPYTPYAGHGAPGYYPHAGYPGYNSMWIPVPTQPKRDTYSLVVGIVAFASSCLAMLGGLGSLGFMALIALAAAGSTTVRIPGSTLFAAVLLSLTLAIAGLVGGGFCLYHSIRSLFLRKPSRTLWLPRFWIFLLCYIMTLGVGLWLHVAGIDATQPVLTGVLIYLGAIFPALTILALGMRRLSFPGRRRNVQAQGLPRRSGTWPTTWRRFTLALVSGATLSILLASVLELILELIMLGSQSTAITQYISDPHAGKPPTSLYGLLLLLVSVIAPFVEELVKPLAVVVLIGRVRSKAEAFALGLACGIGFNLVETTGYISSGYTDWLNVALLRSGAGLLHGFGAAMVALGWYYLTHKEEGIWQKRVLITFACGGYAVFQHALWNGSVGLSFIPGPIGGFFQSWSWSLGVFSIDAPTLANIVEMLGILIFFVYMSGRLRVSQKTQAGAQSTGNALVAAT